MTQNRKSGRVPARVVGKVVNKAFKIEVHKRRTAGIYFIYLAQLILVNLCSNGYPATGYTELRSANTWINKLEDVKSKKCIFHLYYYLISKQKSYKCCQSKLQMGVLYHSVGK